MPKAHPRVDPFLRMPDVLKATGLKKSTVYKFIALKQFPPSVPLGNSARPPVGWRQSEIVAWIRERGQPAA